MEWRKFRQGDRVVEAIRVSEKTLVSTRTGVKRAMKGEWIVRDGKRIFVRSGMDGYEEL